MKRVCPCGGTVHKVTYTSTSPLYGVTRYECQKCGKILKANEVKKTRTVKTNIQRRSIKQEKTLAKRIGGKRQPGSGNGPYKKLDVNYTKPVLDKKGILYECKTTKKGGYRLTYKELRTAEQFAAAEEKFGVFEIQFEEVEGHGNRKFVVLRSEVFTQLLDELQRASGKDH